MSRLLLLNKPFGMLTQFTDAVGRPTLKDIIPIRDIYAAGRLDFDSEGLVVLTDLGWVQHGISDPRQKFSKTYWVQVEGDPTDEALAQLAGGVLLNDGMTAPAKVRRMDPPEIWPRDPPIRYRAAIPTTWIELVITEGRNRQVRRMTAAVGYPTLRLVRYAVGPWTLEGLLPSAWRELAESEWRPYLSLPRKARSTKTMHHEPKPVETQRHRRRRH